MAIVIESSVPQVRRDLAPASSQELRRSDTSAAFGATGADALIQAGGLQRDIAAKEYEMLQQRDRARMLAELSELDIAAEARVQELLIQGTGDKPFVQGVMDDAQERIREFVKTQPNFLKDEAATRALSISTRVAKTAVAAETNRINAQIDRNTEVFNNNLVNRVRFGQLDEATALADIESYSRTLPARLQQANLDAGRDMVRRATLLNTLDTDHRKVIADVKAGLWNDVDPDFVNKVYSNAVAEDVRIATENSRLMDKADAVKYTDPAEAATLALQANGVANPTPDQLTQAQRELGVPEQMQAVLRKSEATDFAVQLSNAQNVDQFRNILETIKVEAETRAVDSAQVVKDIIELGDLPPVLAMIASAPPETTDPQLVSAALSVVRDPEASTKAKANIRRRDDLTEADMTALEQQLYEDVVEGEVDVMYRSGMDPADIKTFADQSLAMATVIYDQQQGVRGTTSKTAAQNAVRRAFGTLAQERVTVTDNNDGYVMPATTAQVLDPVAMDGLRASLIDRLELLKPASIPTDDLSKRNYMANSGWTMEGPNALVLRSQGQPVLRKIEGTEDYEPIVLSFSDLAVIAKEVMDASEAKEFRRPSKRSVVPAELGGGLSRGMVSAGGQNVALEETSRILGVPLTLKDLNR